MPEPASTVAPLVYGVAELGVALGGKSRPLSERTIYRLLDKGELPRPTRIGRRVVWPIGGPNGIEAWLSAGAPSAAEWEAMNSPKTRRRIAG